MRKETKHGVLVKKELRDPISLRAYRIREKFQNDLQKDLDASKNSDPDDKEFPGAGAVAFYLWGINPLDPEPAMGWFMSKAEAIKAERADVCCD